MTNYVKKQTILKIYQLVSGGLNDIRRQRKITGSGKYSGLGKRPLFRPQPFWLPASNYYVLVFSIAVATFFLIWGLLQDGFEETPWVKAGLSASLVLIAAVLIRFFILRRLRERILTERRLDANLRAVASMPSNVAANKLSLEQNKELIRQIKEKSDAAKVLGKLAAAHKEVVELCDNYIEVVTAEIPQIAPGSPRLGAFHKGRIYADETARTHYLTSVELELRNLMKDSGEGDETEVKLRYLQTAVNKVDKALVRYPQEQRLLDSSSALRSAIYTAKVSDMLQRADRAEFDNDIEGSLKIYNDAMFFISRNPSETEQADDLHQIIDQSIRRLATRRESDEQ